MSDNKYTNRNSACWHKWRNERLEKGWRHINVFVPPEVANGLRLFIADYKQSKPHLFKVEPHIEAK